MYKYKKSISGSIKNKKRVPQFPTDELEDCTKTQYTINKDCLSSNANGYKFCVMPVSWLKKKLHYLTPQNETVLNDLIKKDVTQVKKHMKSDFLLLVADKLMRMRFSLSKLSFKTCFCFKNLKKTSNLFD